MTIVQYILTHDMSVVNDWDYICNILSEYCARLNAI